MPSYRYCELELLHHTLVVEGCSENCSWEGVVPTKLNKAYCQGYSFCKMDSPFRPMRNRMHRTCSTSTEPVRTEHARKLLIVQMYTTKTDVWSFGVTLVELCNQQVPYSSLFLTPLQVAIGVADRGLRPAIEDPDIPIPVKQIIDSCFAQDPFQRPNFVAIVAQLKPVVSAVAAAEARSEAAPSLLSRVSQGLGMLQGATAGPPSGTSSSSRRAESSTVRTKVVPQTCGTTPAPCMPQCHA